jgi:hypothetical protein
MLMEQGVALILKVMDEKLICNKIISDGTIQGIYCLLLPKNGVWSPTPDMYMCFVFLFAFILLTV